MATVGEDASEDSIGNITREEDGVVHDGEMSQLFNENRTQMLLSNFIMLQKVLTTKNYWSQVPNAEKE